MVGIINITTSLPLIHCGDPLKLFKQTETMHSVKNDRIMTASLGYIICIASLIATSLLMHRSGW